MKDRNESHPKKMNKELLVSYASLYKMKRKFCICVFIFSTVHLKLI